ncbi:MAG: hypothetical protein BGN88_14040 [Clostridiales bacterium 43-6]|nr:MAG: hypothetical protein BGN88_14040 [Clostridiales bacterium 43-6]
MTVLEKVSYLKGLAEGLGFDESSKQDKLLKAIIEVLDDIAMTVTDLEDDVVELSDQLDAVDEDLAGVEEEIYGYEDDAEDEDFYEVVCPSCGEQVYLDSEMLEEESIDCPACGTELEFDFSCDCDECNEEDNQ